MASKHDADWRPGLQFEREHERRSEKSGPRTTGRKGRAEKSVRGAPCSQIGRFALSPLPSALSLKVCKSDRG